MKVTLGVIQRAVVANILPKEGNITNMRLLREFREMLSFTEEENKLYQPRYEVDGKSKQQMFIYRTVDDEGQLVPQEKEFEVGDVVAKLIEGELKELDKAGKLKDEHIDLYNTFVT
jgi:hypothetical protein